MTWVTTLKSGVLGVRCSGVVQTWERSPRAVAVAGRVALVGVSVGGLAGVSAAAAHRPALRWSATAAVLVLTAVLLWARARRDDGSERAVWSWLTAAVAVAAVGGVAEAVLAAAPSPGLGVAGGSALGLATLCAYPLVYQALIQWNRYRTQVSDPNDWLNGVSAAFAIVAACDLALSWTGSGVTALPEWQLQASLLRVAGAVTLAGTACTVAVLAGLQRDVRVWGIGGGLTVLGTTEAVGLAHGLDTAWAGFGWLATCAALLACAARQPSASSPRGATTQAPTLGALVVLLASVTVLAVGDLADTGQATAGPGVRAAHLATWFALAAVLGVSTRVLHLVRDLAQLAQSRHEAHTDDLTGIANRRALTIHLEQAVTRTGPLSLLVLDLDRFKEVNDRYGHGAGDELLRATAARLDALVPGRGLLARLGGDEFAVLLEGPVTATAEGADDDARDLAERLARAIAGPVSFRGHQLRVGASIGLAVHRPGVTAHELLRQADAAMYQAKVGGGGVRRYDEQVDAESRACDALVRELRQALRADVQPGDDQFEVHYQPQVDVPTRTVVGVEALVRWRHPVRGLLAPDAFVGLVEQHGLMAELTSRVLWRAARQAARWQDEGRPLRLAVNVSTSCLANPGLLPLVDEVLATTGLDRAALVLEITETTLMADPEQALRMTHQLARRGIGISIDDYGTGYSSLAYLNDLPARELKLDRSFTVRLLSDERTTAIVAATVELAHRLGLRVVAEGVEDDRTLEALAALGCDETQGYLHARPMPLDALRTWLQEQDRRRSATHA